MITGVHAIVFSKDAPRMRAFLRDVLGLRSVDAGGGWPIFAAPPAELAVHPTDGEAEHELFLMCDDIDAVVAELAKRGMTCAPIADRSWGRATSIEIAEGESIGLYQPLHPSPLKGARD